MKQQLIVTILGTDSLGILSTLAAEVGACQCNILDSRQAIYGQDFSLTMILEGSQSAITKAELVLPQVCQRHDLLSMMKRTSQHCKQSLVRLADVEFDGRDAVGVLEEITRFFADFAITITAFRQQTDKEPSSNTAQMHCTMVVSMPKDTDIEAVNQAFTNKLKDLQLTGTLTEKH
ncbi:Glycine cleavage system transcriptional repressor [Saliniradius amylolyticus]|uniref:Glycine cleavage system transcriptional repressor n=1 Tax=Saliniradius amylolyticus TaxID=2183582 RepID=A0A2S2E4D1_9ALTE|nr:ACT domain-containing protein [Saliniradius amylolyticus]AWL11867.1 Glycine cleavage system transcriptional repressor [Saliniradius amylolyticus]